jgi:glycosyltransferase involved in cell wall biosynthesis
MKIKLLLCTPELEGGISAVVKGIEKGLEYYIDRVEYRKIAYARRFESNRKLYRIYLEIIQLASFIASILVYRPTIILIESSFDKKTVLRDSTHLLFCKVLRKKMVLHAHGGFWHLIPKWNYFFKRLARFLIKNTDCLIVTSEEEFGIIKRLFKDEVIVFKIDNPVYFPFETKYCEHINYPIKVIFASRFIESKGILDTIQAAKSLKNNRDLVFEIYGNGELFPEVRNIIKMEKLSNVFLKGNIPLDDLIIEYQKGDIFLFPSYHKEGFPMALFFAVGSGLPIIATKVRPLPDFLVENINCIWIEERNPQMIASKVLELSVNHKLMIEMKRANITTIQKFDPINIVGKYLSVLESIV